MNLVDALVGWSVHHRFLVLLLTALAVVFGIGSLRRMTFDAFPDLTNVQVQVLTTAPGMAAEEVELLVTLPVERSLGGVADVAELRSVSRPGVSSVTAVFEDGVDPWLARQMVKEQVDVASGAIPDGVGPPELAPPTTGLGEVYQFTLASDDVAPWDLYRIFQRDVAPRLRGVDGVVEVNAWGGGVPQLDVRVDPYALVAHDLQLCDVEDALAGALAVTSGGDRESGAERASVRAVSNPTRPEELEAIVVRADPRGVVLLGDVARVEPAGAITVGLGTADGEGEVLFAMVQLLAGADALSVVRDVRATVDDIRETLPDHVRLEPIYDREKLVGNTLTTVTHSLVEGGLLVVFVLLVLLGDLRSGLIVASVIPMAMLGAFTGLAALSYSGNLMSLGAIDFGLVVDGTIVVVESIVALDLTSRSAFGEAVVERTRRISRPVVFAVGILVLVYLPVLAMVGTEGKLFRPMALTVLLALVTALILSFTYVPAIASLVVHPKGHHETWLLRVLRGAYRPVVSFLLDRWWLTGGTALAMVAGSALLALTLGVEFVPRLEEGDLVIQTARLPSISPEEARREVGRIERIVQSFPEVERIASRTGSPALATDPMGLEEADILVRLAPRDAWVTADSTEGLTEALAEALASGAPGPEYTFTQPIEMRFNELLEGITSDVGVQIYGPDLDVLVGLGAQLASALEGIPGAADVKAPSVEGMPGVDVIIDPGELARLGVSADDLHGLVAGVRRGREVGTVRRGEFQDPVVLKVDLPADVDLGDLPFALPGGGFATLGDVAEVVTETRPAVVRREAGSRRVVVQANVRGRDLGGFVTQARADLGAIDLPPGYWLEWSGKYEQLQAAAGRTAITVPLVLLLILVVLYYAFGAWRPAWLIFLNVPAAASGGVAALLLRGLPISMSAVVGFVALFGVAVMNGIVLVSRTREMHLETDARTAALFSAIERFRPVLMTAFVAGIGFLPMALATGVGAEVQRPLATVMIGGLCTSTPLTLVVLPSLYARWMRRENRPVAPSVEAEAVPAG
ncbi:MAG: efflux RND transporter permease subunit [Alphaproteobacteria bacterium]|nr:efflux RND transporter permease subunit [Alphaproteobacteria bacterium]